MPVAYLNNHNLCKFDSDACESRANRVTLPDGDLLFPTNRDLSDKMPTRKRKFKEMEKSADTKPIYELFATLVFLRCYSVICMKFRRSHRSHAAFT